VSLKCTSFAVGSLFARELAERGLSVNETARLLGLTQTEDGAGRGEEET
jgi:predicted transcriptional regulator